MSLNSHEASSDFLNPVTESLTKAQKAVLDRVIAILDQDPALREKLNQAFEENFQSIVSDAQKFNLLLTKIGQNELQQLGKIETEYLAGTISGADAIHQSKTIIEHYTQMKLGALKASV